MLKIGDFSKLSRISIRMLRHYDEIGLLCPESVDTFTGYRYYGEFQLVQAGQIRALREYGFGLSEIRTLLEQERTPDELEQLLLSRRSVLQSELHEARQRLSRLDNALEWLRKDGTFMNYTVTLKTMPERYVASLRQTIPSYDQEGILWEQLYRELAPQKLKPANPCYGLAVFHDEGYVEVNPDVEIQLAVVGQYADTEHVHFKTVPEQTIASATYTGSYDQLGTVHRTVACWLKENGYVLDGMFFCIYHVSPAEARTPDDLVTEVCYPVRTA